MPCWLAGVVHGSCTVHSCNRWLPLSTQRRRFGIVPDCSAHWATGNGTPSSCTNTTPSTSGSGTVARFCPNRRSAAVNASSVPAVNIQVRNVPTVAAIQVAAMRVQNDDASTPGTTSRARCIATACPAMATAAAATSHHADSASSPGSSASAAMSASELIAHARAMRARSEARSLVTMR